VADMIRIAINGAGRMARAIVEAAGQRPGVTITALVSPLEPAGATDWAPAIPLVGALDQLPQKPDVLIDFSLPEGTQAAADYCAASGVALLSGVTGLPESVQAALSRAAQSAPVLWSANLSVGVNVLAELCRATARRLDPKTPVSIEDLHHAQKIDAPSGTALMLGKVIEAARPAGSPPVAYHSVREGAHIGAHEVHFELAGERIVLSHTAEDRGIFARGAVAAAVWLSRQPPGRYSAADWLSDPVAEGSETERS